MNKILSLTEAEAIFAKEQVVLITGSFDILHLGHLRLLKTAKDSVPKGVKTLVIILSDKEISRRKGDRRPVFKQNDRVEALSYLESVDFVLPWDFAWEDLRKFVLKVKPDYMAVVRDDPAFENKKTYIEKAGGKVIIIEPFKGFSTTSILEKLDL